MLLLLVGLFVLVVLVVLVVINVYFVIFLVVILVMLNVNLKHLEMKVEIGWVVGWCANSFPCQTLLS